MKEIIYNITQATTSRVITFGVDEVFSKDNILGIINKTQSKVLYTPVNAANIVDVTCNEGTLTISLADNVPVILAGDELFVKLYSENEEKIDTTGLAKQGDDQGATNTAIYNAVKNLPDLSLLYAARAEKNDDGVNTYSIVLPVTAKVTYDDNGVATIQL